MTSAMPGNGGPWEQRVAFEQGTRLQIGDLHGPECSPVEDQSEGGGYRSDGQQHRKKEFKRAWREEWKTKHRWVYPIKNPEGELRLKCHWCSLFNMDNVFAREGCSTIQMSALNTHAKSEAHKIAEGRVSSNNMSLASFPDNLFDGCRNGCGTSRDAGLDHDHHHMECDHTSPGKKRKLMMAANKEGVLSKHNCRILQLFAETETSRNARHASSIAAAKKQLKLDEQRLQVDQQVLEQEKARLAVQVSLGQSLVAALADIGEGLNRIGSAMETRRTLL